MSGEGTSADIMGVTETVGRRPVRGLLPGANMAILGMNLGVQSE